MDYSPEVITKFKIRSNSVVFYPSFELFNTVRGYNAESQKNLQDNKTKGFLSPSSAKKIRDMVENWVNSIKAHALISGASLDSYICFITLTLPAGQVHTDKEIKRQALNKFLIYGSRKWKVRNFIWKAEAQKNGNIHFHILFDRFIPWSEVRRTWNQILSPLGYIQRFASVHGHYDPNSTDVHGLKRDKKGQKVTFIAAYLAKYMSKKGDPETEKDRPIDGRLWGCSDNLKKLVCFSGFDDETTDRFFKSLKNNSELREFSGDYFRVFCGNWFEVSGENRDLMKKIHEFYLNQYFLINDLIETDRKNHFLK